MQERPRVPDLEEMATTCSILVVGAGMGGLSTALELCERGAQNVMVVDHGPFTGFEHRTRTPDVAPLFESPVWWSSASEHYGALPGVASPVGGRSRCWHGVVLPISESTLNRYWPHDTADRLLGDGLGSYQAVSRDLRMWRDAFDTSRQEEVADDLSEDLQDIWPSMSLSPVPQAGWSTDGPHGHLLWAYSPLLAWDRRGFARHLDRELPDVVSGLRAIRVVVQAGRARGVLFSTPDGGTREINADVVVLAGGTLENTRLYAQALAETGEIVDRWPGLNDHVIHGYAVPLQRSVATRWADSRHRRLWSDLEDELNANLFVEVHAAGLREPALDLWWMAQQENPFDNAILFETTSNDDMGWTSRVDASFSVEDGEAVRRRDDMTFKLLGALNVDISTDLGFDHFTPAAEAALAAGTAHRYVAALGTTNHEAGTLPLGRRLDFGGRCPSVDSLFVVGPATFPTVGAANPSLTILALAAHTAEVITSG